MQEAEEQGTYRPRSQVMTEPHAQNLDTCRICGAPAEPDQPLFYPCKCSGTIRYIHQDWYVTAYLPQCLIFNPQFYQLNNVAGSQQKEELRCVQASVLFHEGYIFLSSNLVCVHRLTSAS